jgi:CRISPR-associated protein Csy2
MSTCPHFTHLLVVPRLTIQNANAVSSPLTHGFPSITAFIGLMWALERRARAAGMDVAFKAVGVVCHDHQEQVTDDGFVRAFKLTRNPVSKDGSTAAIVEEGRIHLEVSLLLAVCSNRWLTEPDAQTSDIQQLTNLLGSMRVAGGSVMPAARPYLRRYQAYALDLTGSDEDRQAVFRQARTKLLPGFSLVARDDLLDTRLAELQHSQPQATRLDAWLSLARINWRYAPPVDDASTSKKESWTHDRKGQGWIVPIPVGYGALSELHPPGQVANARDNTTHFRFVESVFSIGQWLSPHRLTQPQQLLWYADSQPDAGLYRCRNDYALSIASLDSAYDFN